MLRKLHAALLSCGLLLACSGGLIRGTAEGMFVSPARPAVAVRPAIGFREIDVRRADLSCRPSMFGSALAPQSVPAVYALFERPEGARLTAMLAVTESDHLKWAVNPETENLAVLRRETLIKDGFSACAETCLLPADKDWADFDTENTSSVSIMRRFRINLLVNRAQLIVEYREKLPPLLLSVKDNLPFLSSFETRAEMAFIILNGDHITLPRPNIRPSYPPSSVSRSLLTTVPGQLVSH
ncbi:MAG: DUF4851 domain-containing protein [Desulfovibrionaceae bacterium]|nr:DUF4851 domain-containing protein [Desulfovibrionaceae bacterium]